MLINRVANTDHSWHKEWTAPRVSPHFDLTLDDKSVLKAIDQLNFIQMKRKYHKKELLKINSYHRAVSYTEI